MLLPVLFFIKIRLSRFWWIEMAGGFLFLLLVDPKLGMARDWDLFASVFIVLSFAIYSGLKRARIEDVAVNRFISSAISIALVINLSFIAINHNFDKGVRRFEHILSFYEERAAYGYENLGAYFRRTYKSPEDLIKALKYYHMALKKNDNPRYMTNIAGTFNIFFERAQNKSQREMFLDSMQYYANHALIFKDSMAIPYDYLSLVEYYRKNAIGAMAYSDSAMMFAQPGERGLLHHHRGIIHMSSQNIDSAFANFKQAIEFSPEFGEPYGFLGRLYLGRQETDSARYYFEEYLKHDPDPAAVPQIEEILKKLR
jgi:tetratricopeptide (TPR) repeat protein